MKHHHDLKYFFSSPPFISAAKKLLSGVITWTHLTNTAKFKLKSKWKVDNKNVYFLQIWRVNMPAPAAL